jgi:hypothetical protein
MVIRRLGIVVFFLAAILLLVPEISNSHVCSDVVNNPSCVDPVQPSSSAPTVNGDHILFTITVRNVRTYDCNPWSDSLTGVTASLKSCNPRCDFSVAISPSSGQTIPISSSRTFNVDITVSPSASGNYQLTFAVSLNEGIPRDFVVDINVEGGGTPGTGGNNLICSACSSQSCDSSSGTCTNPSICSGATYCPGDSSCYFATTASGSASSCCGDDSGEYYKACARSGVSWSCPSQAACCGSNNMCVYSGSCYASGNVQQLTTGSDAYAYCSSGTWQSCDSTSTMCSNCGFSWVGSTCCGDDSGESAKSRVCSSGCSSSSSDTACCSGSGNCVYNGACYASSSKLCVGNAILTCSSGTWTGEDCSSKASTDSDGGCSAYTTVGSVRDYTSCSGTACTYTDYADSCSGSTLTEYCTQGSGYTSSQYDCASGNACVSNLYRVFTCSSGRCSYTDQNPDTSQAYCTGCSKTWVDNSCCGDDSGEYYAEMCPGVTGVSRKCCSNSGDRVNSLGQCTGNCGGSVGTGGDNSRCSSCSTQLCDSTQSICTGQCSSATYCTGSSCVFRTTNSGAAESCCGDDSGEFYKVCLKSTGVSWDCTSQAVCCGSGDQCTFSGSCYNNGSSHQVTTGNDAYAYCSSGTWLGCDADNSSCSSCGFYWSGSACCGDDSGESAKSRVCSSGCTGNQQDNACCDSSTSCVYNGICFSGGTQASLEGKQLVCGNGIWLDVNQTSECAEASCNQNDGCQQCPGCAYMDFSCVGGMCQPSYVDLDSLNSYCERCSLKWSGEGQQRNCCGDDSNEHWVGTCPNVTGILGKCCNSPTDRVNQNGECVSSCGSGGQIIKVNITELKDKPIPVAISIVPEAIDLEPGQSTEFKVYMKQTWNESIHNVSLYFCKEYDFTWQPAAYEELKPNEIKYFTVSMHAPENSTLGKKDFEVYMTADEFLNKKQKNAILTVGKVDYTVYYISAGIVVAIVLVVMLRKVLFSREKSAESKPLTQPARIQPARVSAANPELVGYIRGELGNGTPEGSIREALAKAGWSKEDVDAAFSEAKG